MHLMVGRRHYLKAFHVATLVYGAGRLDASGRVADQAVTGALGWCAGDRLTLTAEARVILGRRDPALA